MDLHIQEEQDASLTHDGGTDADVRYVRSSPTFTCQMHHQLIRACTWVNAGKQAGPCISSF